VTVVQDKVHLSSSIASVVVADCRNRQPEGTRSAFSRLTSREREVLQLLAEGHTTKQIAFRLQLSIKTVSTHREHVMAKLGIRSIAQLTRYAVREGVV
jgi:two-component system secretion response regulator SsrB